MTRISLVLCAYNPNPVRLKATLAGISAQTGDGLEWETLLIDNASSPSIKLDAETVERAHVRMLRETTPGSGAARLRGFRETAGRMVVIVDDDNVLAPGYLQSAAQFLRDHPQVGAVGGINEPVFEAPPPAWIHGRLEAIACREPWPETQISRWWDESNPVREYPYFAPYGAGMCLRADCVAEYIRQIDQKVLAPVAGRIGAFPVGLEDCELLVEAVLKAGWEIAFSPGLTLKHLIPARRCQISYLARMQAVAARQWAQFRIGHGWETPVTVIGGWLRILRTTLRNPPLRAESYLRWRQAVGYQRGRMGKKGAEERRPETVQRP